MLYRRRQPGKRISRRVVCLFCAGVATLATLRLEIAKSSAEPDQRMGLAAASSRRGTWTPLQNPPSNPGEEAFQEARRLEDGRTQDARMHAVEKYEEALGRWREAGDSGAMARTLIRMARVRLDLGQVDQAMAVAREAISISRTRRDHAQEAELHNLLGEHFYGGGDHKRAESEAAQALRLSREAKDPRQEARALHILGNAYHGLDKVKKAIVYQEQALEIMKRLGDLQGQLDVMVKLGYAHVNRSEIQRASEIYAQALAISRSINNRRAEAIVHRALGNLKTKVGENQEAFTHFYQALEILETIDEPKIKATVIGGLAYTYECAGDTKKALEKYQEALECFKALNNRWGIAEAEMPIGEIYFAQQQYSEAFAHYETALKHFREMKMARWEAMTLRNLGLVQDAVGNRSEALRSFRESMALTSAEHDLRSEAYTLSYLGKIYERDGDRARAQSNYKKALEYAQASSDRAGQSMFLFNLARLARESRRLDEALAYINDAIEIVEDLRANLVNHELRATYFASAGQYYEQRIDILMRLDAERPNMGFAIRAFETSERARARSLLESLGESRAGIRKGVDPALLQQEKLLQGRLNEIAERQRRLGPEGRKTEEYAALNREIIQLSSEKQRLAHKIRTTNPQYAALTEPQPLELQEIQRRLLDPDSVLLEFALGEERSYLWVVTQDSFRTVALPPRIEIDTAARNFYKLLSSEENTLEQNEARREEKLRSASRRLSRMLLGSIADSLDRRRLLLASDGFLQKIPFQTLEDVRSNTPGKATLMLERYEIINAPSASTLLQLIEESKDRPPQSKEVVVLADPVYGPNDSRSRAATGSKILISEQTQSSKEIPRTLRDLTGVSGEIPRLYASQTEANSILGLASGGDGMIATGFEASRSLAMSSILSKYRIVHFATHGVLNEEHPELSGIVLSMVDRNGNPQDGILRLHDIYNMILPVDLVVLSACNTAQGKEIKGEGLIGLTRGFMYAGAASVVASLWKVDDEATAELMTLFYRGLLQEKLSAPAALRNAQLAMAAQPRWRSPYFWAGFVIQGKNSTSDAHHGGQERKITSIYIGGAGGAVALIFFGLLLLKQRRNRTDEASFDFSRMDKDDRGMSGNSDNSALLTRYLLGDLSAEDQDRLEERYFHDDHFLHSLLDVKDQLFCNYVSGTMADGDRVRFEKRFLTTAQGQSEVELISMLHQRNPAPVMTPVGSRESRSMIISAPWILRWKASWGTLGAFATAAVLLGFGLWFTNWSRSDHSGPANATVHGNQDPSTVLALDLAPGRTRSENGETLQTVRIELHHVSALLKLKTGQLQYESFHADVLRLGDGESLIMSADGLKEQGTSSGFILPLAVPAAKLARGDYRVKVQGILPSGVTHELRSYYFTVIKK